MADWLLALRPGDVLVESVIESNIGKGPEAVLAMVTRKLDQLLKRSGRTRSSLRGAAIGVPGPVNWQTGRIARSISMPGWDNYPVQDHLVTTLECRRSWTMTPT